MVFYVSIVVSTGYLLLSIISIVQLFRILLYGHKLLSFATYFLLLCLSWTVFRCAYFGFGYIYINLNERNNLLLFYSPAILQFATFSFILVYYEKHIQKQENWRLTKCYIIFIYIFSIIFLATINMISLLIYCYNGSCYKYNDIVNKIHYISFGIFYSILVLLYCIYVRRLWRYHHLYYYSKNTSSIHMNIKQKQKHKQKQDIIAPLYPNNKKKRDQLTRTLSEGNYHQNNKKIKNDKFSKQRSTDYDNIDSNHQSQQHSLSQLSSLRKLSKKLGGTKKIDNQNVTLHGKSKAFFSSKFVMIAFIIFITRCLFYFILATGVWTDTLDQQNTDVQIGGLFCIIFWEWLPTILILTFFRKIPSTDLCCPIFGSFCSYFTLNIYNDNNNNNDYHEHYTYCCCYCCCCGCSNKNIKRRTNKNDNKCNNNNNNNNKKKNNNKNNKDNDNNINNNYFNNKRNKKYIMDSGKYNNYTNNVSISISETSHSLPDISYYKSPPAPIIQKLIQQQAQSWNSHGLYQQNDDLISPSKGSDITCDIQTTPSIKHNHDGDDDNDNDDDGDDDDDHHIDGIHRGSV